MIIGALERELPSALLLLGSDPEEIVLRARAAVRRSGAVLADIFVTPRLTAVSARSIVSLSRRAPFGLFMAFIVQLDEASEQAQNILLKVLEEPPPSVRFILVASKRPLPTVVSRCHVATVPARETRAEPDGKVAAQVATALKAAATADLAALDAALAGWGAEHQSALEARLLETAVEGPGARERWQARQLLGALGRFAGAQPRLAAHAALVTAIDRERHD